jgi:hypothetical protein
VQPPAAQVVLDLGEHGHVLGVARPAPAAHRDALAGRGQTDHDLRQVRSVILGVAVDPERASTTLGLLALEEARGGVEQQQVDLKVEQVGGRRPVTGRSKPNTLDAQDDGRPTITNQTARSRSPVGALEAVPLAWQASKKGVSDSGDHDRLAAVILPGQGALS